LITFILLLHVSFYFISLHSSILFILFYYLRAVFYFIFYILYYVIWPILQVKRNRRLRRRR
jgi:hypothetical protein